MTKALHRRIRLYLVYQSPGSAVILRFSRTELSGYPANTGLTVIFRLHLLLQLFLQAPFPCFALRCLFLRRF